MEWAAGFADDVNWSCNLWIFGLGEIEIMRAEFPYSNPFIYFSDKHNGDVQT
jgi:hypothetical protein